MNYDEINTSVEAVVNNSHGTADNNVSTLEHFGSVALTTSPPVTFGQNMTGNSQTDSVRSNQNTAANTFVSPQANVVFANTAFASSLVYYASTPHTVALPQGFNSSSSPSAHSVVQYNRPVLSPMYTQLPPQYVTPLAQHPAMMQSSPTGTAQAMCK
ncbi:hypothetical protein V6N12_029543 [Hibiscus sabdariffa]|uniref:Uncharacterized protein n=1 Tax=Hibiscus sabdariffa TaxID=183260 RepID=A0ABR2CWI1_9ROSI